MFLNELFERRENLYQGKAVFMAGVPGSGKSSVGEGILTAYGFRPVNVDQFWDLFQSRGQTVDYDVDYAKLDEPRKKRLEKLSERNLNLLIDGTGASVDSIKKMNDKLKSLGYQTAMIAISMDPVKAVHNTIKREFKSKYGRSVTPEYVFHVDEELTKNLSVYKSMFSYPNFFQINTDYFEFYRKDPTTGKEVKVPIWPQIPNRTKSRIMSFLEKPNPAIKTTNSNN